MNSKTIALLLSLSTLCAGCATTGPNTQRGAVAGATAGAVAGGIIGNNSRGGNGAEGAIIGGVVGAAAGGVIGNSMDRERGSVYYSEDEARTDIIVESPPPPPPAPRDVVRDRRPYRDAVWVRGYWTFTGRDRDRGRYEWVPGHWETPPRRDVSYVPPHWSRSRHGYIYVQGYWR